MNVKVIFVLLFFSIAPISYAGWISDRLDDVRDSLDDAADYIVEKEGGLVALKQYGRFLDDNLWQKIFNGDEEGGFGEDELVAGLTDFYVGSLDNSNLSLVGIEGDNAFSWVPIGLDVITFIPVYSNKIPQEPTAEEIWNDTDADADGIYDDMEYFVVRNIEDKTQRLAAYRYVHSIKQLADNINDSDRFKTAIVNVARAETCMGGMSENDKTALYSATISSMSRLKAYWNMNYRAGDLLISLNKINELACTWK